MSFGAASTVCGDGTSSGPRRHYRLPARGDARPGPVRPEFVTGGLRPRQLPAGGARPSGLPAQLRVVQIPLPTPVLLDVGSLLRVSLDDGVRGPHARTPGLGPGVGVLRLGAHGGAVQCLSFLVSRPTWGVASALALRSLRFSLIDLPDFFDIECRGDLSAIARSLTGNLSGSVTGRYAPWALVRDARRPASRRSRSEGSSKGSVWSATSPQGAWCPCAGALGRLAS
jgi:hypothetical protein